MYKKISGTFLSRPFISLITWLIYGYRALSPVLGTNACCRFEVSCSEYTLRAFQSEPFLKACAVSCKRLLSCHPWS